jgi:hypothetical protein
MTKLSNGDDNWIIEENATNINMGEEGKEWEEQGIGSGERRKLAFWKSDAPPPSMPFVILYLTRWFTNVTTRQYYNTLDMEIQSCKLIESGRKDRKASFTRWVASREAACKSSHDSPLITPAYTATRFTEEVTSFFSCRWKNLQQYYQLFVCSILCTKTSFMKKTNKYTCNYIPCLLATPTCFGRLLRPSLIS